MISQLADPFDNHVVRDAWATTAVNVETIHRAVFDACLSALEKVRQSPGMPTRSVLIYGSAGSGKTHLLGRLRKAVVEEPSKHPANFCYVRLATSPSMIRRHVRRCLADDMLRPDESTGLCQLDRILLARISKSQKPVNANVAIRYLKRLPKSAPDQKQLSLAIGSLDEKARLGRNFARACELWLLRKYRRDIEDWFKGGDIPDEARTRLGFARDSISSDDDPEMAAQDIILRWSRLISGLRPLVLCFDQIEALVTGDGSAAGLVDFGRFVANLYEESPGTLIVTCIQAAFKKQFEEQIRRADFDRLAGETWPINPLTLAECESLACACLDDTFDLKTDEHRKTDRLWPIDRDRFAKWSADETRTARELICYCRDEIRDWRSGKPGAPAQPPKPDQFLNDEFEHRRDRSLGRVDDSQTTLAHGLPQLVSLVGKAAIEPSPRPEIVDCSFTKDGKRSLVSVCNQRNAALPARLKRLQAATLPIGELVLVRDSTLPIPATSKVARRRWAELQENGARVVRPTVEALAALEALRTLLSDAKAGDLSNDGQTVEPRTVEEWVRKQLLDEQLEKLAAEVLHPSAEIIQHAGSGVARPGPQVDELFNDLLDEMQRRHVAPADELAAVLKADANDIVGCAGNHPAEFGLIGEPPTLVFEKCAAASQEGS